LKDITLVVLCAGNSTRFDNLCKKQWIRIDNEPLWLNVTNRLTSFSNFSKTIVVSHKDELSNKSWKRFSFAEQEMYITDAIKLQSNVADNFQLELNNDILKQLLVRLKLIY
jgi:2-C-methyl-D-erythritol 4-phosphate cytidylyltransferase